MQMFPSLSAASFNNMSSDDLEDYIAQSMAINPKGHITYNFFNQKVVLKYFI